jgi:hypothetical protein
MNRELRKILSQIEFAQFEPKHFNQQLELALSRIRALTEDKP